jgi:hypothetical protein
MGESHKVTDIERRKNNRIDQITPEERATLAHQLAIEYAEGTTYAQMGRTHSITTAAVKTLLQEHAAYIRNARPDTRSLQEEEYMRMYGEMKRIDPTDNSISALIRAKAIEARIQLLTRRDKLLGHELQGDMDGAVNTVAEMVRAMNQRGDFDGVSAMDLGKLHQDEEDVVEAEVIEDDTDRPE